MGTMGFGLPAAIGAQFANPDKTVINIDGDGSIRMNLGELETVTTYNLPVKILVLNNSGDGMVRQWQRLFFAERFCGSDKSLHKKDFVKAAEADGFEFAVRVSDKAELPQVLRQFVEYQGPAFLEVVIDQNACVYPMIGPGAGYKEMVTGEFIPARAVAAQGPEKRICFNRLLARSGGCASKKKCEAFEVAQTGRWFRFKKYLLSLNHHPVRSIKGSSRYLS